MNADEMNWLLRTIEDPGTANRFVQAQYQRGRISNRVMEALAREHGWTDCASLQLVTAAGCFNGLRHGAASVLSVPGAIS